MKKNEKSRSQIKARDVKKKEDEIKFYEKKHGRSIHIMKENRYSKGKTMQ